MSDSKSLTLYHSAVRDHDPRQESIARAMAFLDTRHVLHPANKVHRLSHPFGSDLLESSQAMLAHFEHCPGLTAEDRRLIDDVRAAIVKARGQS
mgnify:CR=1 FL=1